METGGFGFSILLISSNKTKLRQNPTIDHQLKPILLECVPIWYPCHFPFVWGKVFALNLRMSGGIGLNKGWGKICIPSDTSYSLKVYRFASAPFRSQLNGNPLLTFVKNLLKPIPFSTLILQVYSVFWVYILCHTLIIRIMFDR